jgi:hypothetical protein
LSRKRLLVGGSICGVVVLFDLGWGAMAEIFVDADVVEPVDVARGGEFEVVRAAPRAFPADQLGLVETR